MPLPNYLPSLLVGQTAFAATVVLYLLGWLQPLDLWAYDRGLTLRANPGAADDRIVLIRVREQDLAETGWPLSDAQLADLLTVLAQAGPAAIGIDIYRDRPVAPGEDALRQVLERHPNILWVHQFPNDTGRAIPPPEPLIGTDRTGFADLIPDPDGVVRRGLLYLDDPTGTIASGLGLAMALRLLDRHGIVPSPDPDDPQYLRLGAATIPPLEPTDGAYRGVDARGYQFLLDYSLGAEPFPSFSIREALDGRIPPEALTGRLVFVAVTADSVRDDFRTPLGDGFTYGVVLHAQTAGQLLRLALGTTPPMATLADAAELTAMFGAGLAGSVIGLALRGALMFAAAAVGGTAILVALSYTALTQYVWLPVAGPAITWLAALGLVTAYLSWRERVDRETLMQLFAIHVAAPVAQQLWQNRHAFMAGGRPRPQRLTATVLFSDIAGFTPVSERLDPEALNTWLHSYMNAMVPIILDHGGLVMSFLGDGIFAVFGAPIARVTEAEIDHDAAQAVRAALAMERALDALNEHWRRDGLPPVAIRVGIHTGPMVAGSIGGPGHMEYTLIGDAVNTASRLESLAKSAEETDRPIRILVSGSTWNRLGGAFAGRAIGDVALKGKDQRVGVHMILGERAGIGTDRKPESSVCVTRFTAAPRPPLDTGGADPTGRPQRKGSLE